MAAITIHNANCFDVLEAWDGPPVDFLFADLPYGTTRNKWDSVLDLARLWPLLRKVCKPNAAMCFTAQQPFTTTLIASNMGESVGPCISQQTWRQRACDRRLSTSKHATRRRYCQSRLTC